VLVKKLFRPTAFPCSITQDLLDLADLFLNFAGYLFTGAFSFQLRIIA
jgi:hypothetical protein